MIVVVTGPTGVGKTALSIELAKKLNGEIINADSTQVYKGLDVATAKITPEEKENIIHHLLDIKEITENYTVFDYQRDGRNCINDILKRGKNVIIVGGTGLYIKALLYDYNFSIEEKVRNNHEDLTNQELYDKLLNIDPETEVHPNNRKRVIRALEYYDIHNKLNDNKNGDKLLYDAIFIGLTTDRDTLYERINKRVELMVNNGLLEEAKKIYDSGVRTKAVLTPIGYKELFPYFDGESNIDECLELIKQRSRKYAKRQYTWFNNKMNIKWFNVDFDSFGKTIDEVLNYIEKNTNE